MGVLGWLSRPDVVRSAPLLAATESTCSAWWWCLRPTETARRGADQQRSPVNRSAVSHVVASGRYVAKSRAHDMTPTWVRRTFGNS
jgi:hypothetical protein